MVNGVKYIWPVKRKRIMGISERKEREKVELKRLILQAAKDVFLEKGYDQTSIRGIADRIEYSPTTIYLYFKDKASILHEIHAEGFLMLNQNMSVLLTVADPYERLKKMGKIYIEFAVQHPGLYDLMFIQASPMAVLDACEVAWHEGEMAFGGSILS